jgi:hypothetical protein
MVKYYIYHIPTFKWKDGSIGKIGCAKDHIQRVSEQGYSEYTILEIHNCIYEASKREIELQKEHGYKVDASPYFISVKNRRKWSKEDASKGGKTNVKTGHLLKISKLGGKSNNVTERNKQKIKCIYCNRLIGGVANYKRYHGEKCKMKGE